MNSLKKLQMSVMSLFAMLTLMLAPSAAFAFTVPSSGTFGYDLYDIVVTKILSGPIGWVGAVMLFVFGISQIMKQWMITLVCVIGATCIVKMTTILTSLGAVIQ